MNPERAEQMTDAELVAARAELRAVDSVFEYEQLRRLRLGQMKPEQLARAADLARERMETVTEPEIREQLGNFLIAIDIEARSRAPRKIVGTLNVNARS